MSQLISLRGSIIMLLACFIQSVFSTWRTINTEFVGSNWSDSVKNWKIVGVSTSPSSVCSLQAEVDACHSSCLTCNGDMFDNCLTCVSNTKAIVNNTCICADGYYPQYQQAPCLISPCFTCQLCDPTCGNCYGPTSQYCLSCQGSSSPQRYLQNFQCVLDVQCIDGTFPNFSTLKCDPCHQSCATCNGGLDSQCLTCPALRYLNPIASLNAKCVSTCPIAKVLIVKTCLPCLDTDCIVCQNDLANSCIQCTTDTTKNFLLFNKICLSQRQNTQQYEDHQKGAIFSCISPCFDCDKYNGASCVSCVAGYSLYLTTCLTTCPFGMYSLSQICLPCNPNCLTCTGTDSTCLTCNTNMFVDPADKKCKVCPNGTYGDVASGTCLNCHNDCLTCDGGSNTNCLTCKTAVAKVYYIALTKQCVDVCPALPYDLYGDDVDIPKKCVQGQDCPNQNYPDATLRLCKPCNPLCSKCFGPSNVECSECSGIKYLEVTECVDSCNAGEYPDAQRVCQICDKSCKECTGGGPNNCIKCDAPLFLMISGSDKFCKVKCDSPTFGNQATLNCVNTCDPNFYPNTTSRICTPCDSACNGCTGGQKNDCLNCAAPYFMFNGTCDYCPDSYFGNLSTFICDKCPNECAICTGGSTCQKCNSPYFLQGSTCILACPAPKWGSSLTNTCESICPIGTYGIILSSNQRICQNCINNCANCLNQIACVDCFYPYFLNNNNICVLDCPSNQFANRQIRACQDCDLTCKTCIGPLKSNCKSCSNGLLYDNTCYVDCPDGTFANGDYCSENCEKTFYADIGTKKCEKCNVNCQECDGKLFNNCITCPAGKIMIDRYCVDRCPSGYYVKLIGITEVDSAGKSEEKSQRTCYKCPTECQLCINTTQQVVNSETLSCQQCTANFYLDEGKCIQQCPSTKIMNIPNRSCDICPLGYYKQDSRTCRECHFSCKKCSGSNYNECTECWDSRGRESTTTSNVLQHLPYRSVCECAEGLQDLMENECTSVIGNEYRTAKAAESFSIIFVSLMFFDLYFFGNPVNVLFSFELVQQVSLLQYTNAPLSLDINSILQFISGFHLTDLPPKPFNLDINSPTSQISSQSASSTSRNVRILSTVIKSQSASYKFSSNGKSTNFLNNSFYLMGVHIGLWAFIFFCKMSMKNFKMKRLGFLNKVYFYVDLTVMLVVYFITNYEMFLNMILQLNDVDTSTSFNSLSLALCIIFLVYYSFFFIKILFKINVDNLFFKSKPPRKPYLINQFTRWCLLFFTVRQRKPMQRNFYIILQVKKMLICISLVTLYTYPEVQILSTLFVYILFFIYLVISKPIVNPYILGLLLVNEAFMIVFFIFTFIIQQFQYSVDISIHLNRTLLALIFLVFFANALISFTILFKKRKQIQDQLMRAFNTIRNIVQRRNRVKDYQSESKDKKKSRKKSQRVDKMGDIIEEDENDDEEEEDNEDDDDNEEDDNDGQSQDVYLQDVEGEGASNSPNEKRLRRHRKKKLTNLGETQPSRIEKQVTTDYYHIADKERKRRTGVVYLKEDLNFNKKIQFQNHLRRDQRLLKIQNNQQGNVINSKGQRTGTSSISINQMNNNNKVQYSGSSNNLNNSILDNSIVNNLDNSMDQSFQHILDGNNISINNNNNNYNNENSLQYMNNIGYNDWEGNEVINKKQDLEQVEEIDELIDEALDQDGEINIERIKQLQIKRSDHSPMLRHQHQDLRNSYMMSQSQLQEEYIGTQENFNHRPSSRLEEQNFNNYSMNNQGYQYGNDYDSNNINNENDQNDNGDDYNLNKFQEMDVQFQELFGFDRVEYYNHDEEEEERIQREQEILQREAQELRYQNYLNASQQSAMNNMNVYQNNSKQSGIRSKASKKHIVGTRDYADPNLIERYNQVDPDQLKKYLEYKKKYKLTQKFGFLSKPIIGSSPQKLSQSQSRAEDPSRIASQLELFYQQQGLDNYEEQ